MKIYEPVILKNYFVDVTINQVFKRLGYNKHKTQIDTKTINLINELIEESQILSHPSGLFKHTEIEIINDTVIFKETNHKIINSALSNHIKKNGGNSVIMLACTIGMEIVSKISFYLTNNANEKAVILDAISSELVENNMNYIEKICLSHYSKSGSKTNFRFSPGYRNVDLCNQKIFNKSLNLSTIGITYNENYILIPEKSITAFLPFKSI